MTKKNIPSRKPKIVLRASPLVLKVILTLLILFSMAALVALRWVHQDIQSEIGVLKAQAAQVEYDNEILEQRSQNVGSVNTIKEIAQDELGLVDPGTVVIRPQSSADASASQPES